MSRSPKAVRPEIIYDATKKFQQHHKDLEILMVNHTELLCLEVIANLDEQIVRIYLNMKLLITKIDLTAINAKFLVKRKAAKENQDFFDCGQVMRHIATNMVAEMVFDRLEIIRADDTISATGAEFEIFLKPTSTDKTMECLDPETFNLTTKIDFELNERPRRLKPFNLIRHRIQNIKFGNIDHVEVIRSSPRNRDKSVRFALPIDRHQLCSDDDATSCTTSEESSVNSDLTSNSVDDLSLFMPQCTLSESDLCALNLDSCESSPISCASRKSALSSSSSFTVEDSSQTTSVTESSSYWKRRLFTTLPVSPTPSAC